MIIHGLNKTTLLDFPGKVACTVFTGGCNMRCIFCQNAPLVLSPEREPQIPEEEFFRFLEKRRGILEGVCITGGEPTLRDDLEAFVRKIRDAGELEVKLDTNGLRPDVLSKLLSEHLVDAVAMDIKGDPDSYPRIAGISSDMVDRVRESAAILMASGIDYEFRTTIFDGMLSDNAFEIIGRWLSGAGTYYLQAFEDSGACMTSGLGRPKDSDLERYRDILSRYVKNVRIRGMVYG